MRFSFGQGVNKLVTCIHPRFLDVILVKNLDIEFLGIDIYGSFIPDT